MLAGMIVGEEIRGTQAQGVVSTVKHYALNDQETARTSLTANISWAAARESDLWRSRLPSNADAPAR